MGILIKIIGGCLLDQVCKRQDTEKIMKKLAELLSVKTNINNVSNNVIFRILTMTVLFALGILFVWVTRTAWILVVVAFFLALALSPPVNLLAKRITKGSRGVATGIAYLAVLGTLTVLLSYALPPIVSQTRDLIDDLPKFVNNLETSSSPVASALRRFDLVNELRNSQSQITERLTDAGGPLVAVLQTITSSLVAVVTVLVLTFFMLVEGPEWLNRFWSLQDKDREKHRKQLAAKMYRIVTRYVSAQLLLALLLGVVSYIILRLFGIQFALSIATLSGIFGLIPLIGATLAGVLMVLVALFKSFGAAVAILIIYVVYQQVENSFIQPMVHSRSVDMSPLLILVSAIVGATLAGLLGALLAIPVAASIRVLVNDYIERHHVAHREPKSS